MRWRFYFLILLYASFAPGCGRNDHPFSKLQRLEGSWVAKMGNEEVMESWKQESDTLFRGAGFEIAGSDTTLFETISLVKRSSDVFYIVSVPGQNDELPVSFRLTGSQEHEFTFENPDHDFPDKIVYRFIDDDHLQAIVSGIVRNEPRSLEFNFERSSR
jgi:hypothetical protein